MSHCRLCESALHPVVGFGPMPIANGFLTPEQLTPERLAAERFFPLELAMCPACAMVQLVDVVDEAAMFNADYAFFSSTSVGMARHFGRFAADVKARWLPDDPFVVELGCNDGIMLRHFGAGRHLGVEPSGNVAEAARRLGLDVDDRFFTAELADEIRGARGPADAILGANVVCHIPYLDAVFDGVRRLLGPKGVFAFEDPYIGDILARTAYDQIYDEHVYYFSLTAVVGLAARHGLDVIDAERQPVHGGEVRFTLAHRGARPIHPRVGALAAEEATRGLGEPSTYDTFAAAVAASKEALVEAVRETDGPLVGYGATSKSTTVLNYCGLGPDDLAYISDVTPTKIGRYTPGSHIPVRSYAEFCADPPRHALLFAWNHAEEIMAKEAAWRAAGGRFLTYVPRVGWR